MLKQVHSFLQCQLTPFQGITSTTDKDLCLLQDSIQHCKPSQNALHKEVLAEGPSLEA
jgi:hypothetical protein